MTARKVGVAFLLVLAACGSGGESGTSGSEGRTTIAGATADSGPGTSVDGRGGSVEVDAADGPEVDRTSFELATDLDEIWASTGDRAVCSPAEPAASIVRFAPAVAGNAPASDELVVAMLWWETPGGELRRRVLQRDGDAWTGPFGPARAKQGMEDLPIELAVVGFDEPALERLGLDRAAIEAISAAVITSTDLPDADADGAVAAEARAAIDVLSEQLVGDRVIGDIGEVIEAGRVAAVDTVTVLAPVPCGADQQRDRRGRSRTDAELTVELAGDVPDGIELWATSDSACSNGPTTVDLVAMTTGRPTGARAQWTLPNGTAGSITLRRSDVAGAVGSWQGRLGPFVAPRSMPEIAELPVSVTVRDDDGDEATTSTVMIVRRPVACAAAGPPSSNPGDDGTAAGTPTGSAPPGPTPGSEAAASVTGSLSAREIWATADGRCPSGATSVRVDARTTGPVTSVDVRVLRSGGAVVTSAMLTSSADGRWTGTIGPISGVASMPESSTLTVEFGARGGTRIITDDDTITLRRPAACGPDSSAAPTTLATGSPASSTPPTAGTTAPAPTPAPSVPSEALSITGSVSGNDVWATATGLCTNGATTVTVEALTTGPATEAQVRAILPGGGTLATVTLAANGAGRWRGTLGPIAAQQSMPDTATVTLQFGARASGGGSATDSRSITLHRPAACASAPPVTAAPPTEPAPTAPPTLPPTTTTVP